MKVCKKCEVEKSLDAFGKDNSTRDKLTRWCRACKNANQLEAQRRYREAHPEKTSPEAMRRWHLMNKYGITPEKFDEMLEAQGGRCAVCPTLAVEDSQTFRVDHSHACCPGARSCGGCVRGLLCHNCNVSLGLLKENEETILNLLNYIRS